MKDKIFAIPTTIYTMPVHTKEEKAFLRGISIGVIEAFRNQVPSDLTN
jgi:hypothetical protein